MESSNAATELVMELTVGQGRTADSATTSNSPADMSGKGAEGMVADELYLGDRTGVGRQRLAAVVGPTGVGKSRVAVEIAGQFGGEIISCDSMQIYKGMDIGTAKISLPERKGIAHHMIDIVSPDMGYSVADYQREACRLIGEIHGRNKVPILVGGTGLYYQAVVDDYSLYPIKSDPLVRLRLQEEVRLIGCQAMHDRLEMIDPIAAAKIEVNDQKRIIRALESIEASGQLFSALQRSNPEKYDLTAVGITMPRADLYARVDQRVDEMIQCGLRTEVEKLIADGYNQNLNPMQALGYAQIIAYMDGRISWQDCIGQIKMETRRYAKRQLTWFRRDQRIRWFDVAEYDCEGSLIASICEHFSRTITTNVE